MNWDGKERRQHQEFCSAHMEFVSDIATIKNSLTNIEKNIATGISFKNACVIGFISLVASLVIQLVTFSYLFGQLSRQVDVNTVRLNIVEENQTPHGLMERIQAIQFKDK